MRQTTTLRGGWHATNDDEPHPHFLPLLQDLKVKLADAPEDKGDIWLAEVPPKPKPVPLIVRARMQREKERLLMEAEEAGELANVDPGVLGPARTKYVLCSTTSHRLPLFHPPGENILGLK